MSEQIVQVADSATPTKNMRTIQQTAGGNTVQSEVVVLATGAANGGDTYDSRQIRALTSTDVVTVQGQASLTNWVGVKLTSDATNPASVINGAPTNQYGLVTRNIPSGTQSVTGTINVGNSPTVTANQGTPTATAANRWPVQISDGTNLVDINTDQTFLTSHKGQIIFGYDVSSGNTAPLPLIAGQVPETVAVSVQGAGIGIPIGLPSLGLSGNGTITAAGQFFLGTVSGGEASLASFEVTGTFTGVMVIEAQDITSFNFYGLPIKNTVTGQWVTNITLPGMYQIPNVNGVIGFRIRATSWSSGSAVISPAAGIFPQTNLPNSGPIALPVPPELISNGATDPTGLLQPLRVDAGQNFLVSPAPAQGWGGNYQPAPAIFRVGGW